MDSQKSYWTRASALGCDFPGPPVGGYVALQEIAEIQGVSPGPEDPARYGDHRDHTFKGGSFEEIPAPLLICLASPIFLMKEATLL